MKLIEPLDPPVFDGWNYRLFEEIDSDRRSHEVHAVEGPALPSQPLDDVTMQDRSGRMADEMEPHFGQIGKIRRLLAGSIKLHSSALGPIRNGIRILFHLAPDCRSWHGQ